MNVRLIRFVAGVVAAAVVSVLGSGMATASTLDRLDSQITTATAQQNTHTVGDYVGQLRTYLEAAAEQGNVDAVEAAIKHLRPVFDSVSSAPVERAALELTDRADVQAAQIERDLPGLTLLAPITGLLTSLLTTLLDLVTSLLGGLPVPVPLPELPELPLPELPGVPLPELPVPTPELPDVPAPDVPAPDVPAPDVPAPEVPEVPAPDAPEAPAPDVPAP